MPSTYLGMAALCGQAEFVEQTDAACDVSVDECQCLLSRHGGSSMLRAHAQTDLQVKCGSSFKVHSPKHATKRGTEAGL